MTQSGPPDPPESREPGQGHVDTRTFTALLEAYRLDPGNHSAAARHALVTRKTAARAYLKGWPRRPGLDVPIVTILRQEAETARTRVQLAEERAEVEADRDQLDAERDREVSRQQAIRVKEQELQLVAAARAGSILGLGAAVKAASGLQSAMIRLGKELGEMAEGGPLTSKEVGQLSSIMRRYSSTLRELAAAGQLSMEMERLRVGDPTHIVGVMSDLDAMPIEELVKMAGYQRGVLERAQERGLVVLDGGKKSEKSVG